MVKTAKRIEKNKIDYISRSIRQSLRKTTFLLLVYLICDTLFTYINTYTHEIA